MPPVTDDNLIAPPPGVSSTEAVERNLEQSAAVFENFLRPPVDRDEQGRFTPRVPSASPGDRPPPPPMREGEAPPEDPRVKLTENEQADNAQPAPTESEEEIFEIDLGDGQKHTLSASELAELVSNRGKPAPKEEQSAQPNDEVARARAEIEAERAKVQQERYYYAQQLAQFVPQAIRDLQTTFPEIKSPADLRKLSVEDPARYVQFIAMRDTISAAQQDQQRLHAQAQAEQSAAMEKYVNEQLSKLHKAEPVFADPVKGPAERKALHSFLVKQGFSADELEGLTDHRTVIVARKAMLFDAMMAAKPADKKVAPVLRSIRPGAARASQPAVTRAADARSAALKNLESTRSVDALAGAFRAMGVR